MDKKELLVLFCCSIFTCFLYLFFTQGGVKNGYDFLLWIIPGIGILVLPVAAAKLKEGLSID